NAVAKKIIFQAEAHGRFSIPQTKEIEMVNGQSSTLIFVHDGKGRTRYRGVIVQAHDETLREQGLAAAQFTLERQYGTGHKILRNLARDCFRFSGAVGNERSHGAICDLRLESPAVASHPL